MAKKRVKGNLTIRLSLVPGRCRWCGCTEYRPCTNGCSWVERTFTLCSECASIDEAMQTARGRRELVDFLQEHRFLAMPDKPRRPA